MSNVLPLAAALPRLPEESNCAVVERVKVLVCPVIPILQIEAGMLDEAKVPLAEKTELVEDRLRFQDWLLLIFMVLKLVITYSAAYWSGVLNVIFDVLLVIDSSITA